jgi:CRP-like cAMP-binding protein
LRELASDNIVGLLLGGCWASLPVKTIESLIAGGRLIEFSAGHTVYAEADAEELAVIVRGLLRVYMHASDGRQVTVRYVRRGDLLGVPALVGGPAPVSVQAIVEGAAFFFNVDRVKRAARVDASVAWVSAEESVHDCTTSSRNWRATRSRRSGSGSPAIFSILQRRVRQRTAGSQHL